jgi:hypothetical protein
VTPPRRPLSFEQWPTLKELKVFDQPVAEYQNAGYSLTKSQTEVKMARVQRI